MTLRVASIGECMIEIAATGAGHEAHFGFGGDTLNTAIYLARSLDGDDARVDYVTALGDDPFSDAMVGAWAAEGLGVDLVFRLPDALPGLYVIRTGAGGERSFYYWRERAAARSVLAGDRAAHLRAALAGHALVYLSGITLAILDAAGRAALVEMLGAVRANGGRVAFDSNFRPRLWTDAAAARRCFEAFAAHTDIALPGLDDETAVFGDTDQAACADRWASWGVDEVVVKNAGDACLVAAGGERTRVAADAVAAPVDTTAAGDSFNGAYLAARLRGAPPAEAARRGHALAREVIGHHGAIVPR